MSHMFKNAYKFNQNLRTKLVQNKKNGS
ncbi:hypothetical protein JIY74_24630 [Vibrio harveyi]|nr:hypothetical protein [Vibrio harveyi]